jgi:glycosyltransferase involved in cell wall biosynthesis
MEIIFLDNGLISKGEHSYSLARSVAGALSARHIEHRIFGCTAMDPLVEAELDAVPHFRRSLYESEAPTPTGGRLRSFLSALRCDHIDRSIPSEQRSWKILNETFEEDLLRLPESVWRAGNLVVLPAISQNQILGLVRFLLSRADGERPRVICQLMFAPSWVPWGTTSRLGARHYRKAFELAAPLAGRTLFFTAENSAIAGQYLDQFGVNAGLLPIPFGQTPKAPPPAGRPRFGFFGYSKCDKGFHLLPRAIAFCRERGVDAAFTVQIQHSGWEAAAIEAERELRSLPAVRLLDGVLTSETYSAETGKIDVMLLPYDPVAFGLRGSGIFTQSVGAGRPVVASAGTFAGESIRRREAEGEIFAPYDAEHLAEAIERIIPNLPERSARAVNLAADFAQRHSPDAYVDILLGFANA